MKNVAFRWNASEAKVNRELLRHEKSAIFSLIRDVILFEQVNALDNLGARLSVSWPLSTFSAETLNLATMALKCLNRINYSLYRLSYQRLRKNLRHYAKESGMDWRVLRDNLRRG